MMSRRVTGVARRALQDTLTIFVSLYILSACSSMKANERFYAFGDGDYHEVHDAAGSQAKLSIVVSAVTVPEFMDRPQIVTRTANSQVNVSEQNRWAEPIKLGIARVVAGELVHSLASAGRPASALPAPQGSAFEADWRVIVDVLRFDAVPGGDITVEALWTARNRDGRTRSGLGKYSSAVGGSDYAAIVAGWENLLRSLARDIARGINDKSKTFK